MHEHSPESYYHLKRVVQKLRRLHKPQRSSVLHCKHPATFCRRKSLRSQGDKTQIEIVHFSPDLDTGPSTVSGMAISRKKFFIRAYFRNRMFSSQAAPSAGKINESVSAIELGECPSRTKR